MTTASAFGGFRPASISLPTPPSGWPIGGYDTYEQAQEAVDYLADNNFPVHEVTIVGIGPMLVERVQGRLTWGRVLGAGAAGGAWFGLFVGLLLSIFTPSVGIAPLLLGLVVGVVFGLASAAARYGATRGRRDFTSQSQLVAQRYDVLCQPRNAELARQLLAELASKTRF